jgi:hypothetical protein
MRQVLQLLARVPDAHVTADGYRLERGDAQHVADWYAPEIKLLGYEF